MGAVRVGNALTRTLRRKKSPGEARTCPGEACTCPGAPPYEWGRLSPGHFGAQSVREKLVPVREKLLPTQTGAVLSDRTASREGRSVSQRDKLPHVNNPTRKPSLGPAPFYTSCGPSGETWWIVPICPSKRRPAVDGPGKCVVEDRGVSTERYCRCGRRGLRGHRENAPVTALLVSAQRVRRDAPVLNRAFSGSTNGGASLRRAHRTESRQPVGPPSAENQPEMCITGCPGSAGIPAGELHNSQKRSSLAGLARPAVLAARRVARFQPRTEAGGRCPGSTGPHSHAA